MYKSWEYDLPQGKVTCTLRTVLQEWRDISRLTHTHIWLCHYVSCMQEIYPSGLENKFVFVHLPVYLP